MAEQNLRRPEALPGDNYSDYDVTKEGEQGAAFAHRPSRDKIRSTQPYNSAIATINRNPLNPLKDGAERVSAFDPSTATTTSNNELGSGGGGGGGGNAAGLSSTKRSGYGSVSYFPDQVARVSYVASVVKPDANGDYLKDLRDGMNLLATRLAPSFFPGTVVRGVTTQVDGYFPAVCPSERFTNCQDVTASIGIYLTAIPIQVNETEVEKTGNYNSFGSHTGTGTSTTAGEFIVDPSTMTQELIAFQESFEVAIANNELQEAIQHEYRQNHDIDSDNSPPVVIVTETIGIGGIDVVADIGNNLGNVLFSFTDDDNRGDSSTDTSDVANDVLLDEPVSTIIGGDEIENRKDIGMATTGGVVLVVISLLLVSLLAIRRRRRGGNEARGASFVKLNRIRKKTHGKDNPKAKKIDTESGYQSEGYDQSGQILLQNVYLAESDSDSDDGVVAVLDVETGNTSRTMRTAETESTNTTGSTHERKAQEILVPIVLTDSSDYKLGDYKDTETTNSESDDSNRAVYNNVVLPIMEYNYATETEDIVTRVAIPPASDGLASLNNKGLVDAYDIKYDEDDDNEYVMCDDTSDISVGEHLLSVTRSSALNLLAARSAELADDAINSNPDAPVPPAALTESNVADISPPHEAECNTERADDVSISPLKSPVPPLSIVPSTESSRSIETKEEAQPLQEMDLAIANGDWAAVGATAALMANNSPAGTPNHRALSRRKKRGSFSSNSSSHSMLDYNEKANELDKLIEAGDWEAVAVTAAKYNAEGEAMAENRSCLSMASTHGSETEGSHANDSVASNMDHSSVDPSMNTSGRSMATSASQKERLQEIRDRITQMVRDVVPDEVDNVEEMMMQFKGKEDDLMETLRTMKERDVARKARLASQNLARRNTRARDKTEDIPSAINPETKQFSQDETIATVERGVSGENSQDSYTNTYTTTNNNVATSATGSSITTDETDENEEHYGAQSVGSFINATIVDPDKAAADAAAWAIQRSLDELIEREEREAHLKK